METCYLVNTSGTSSSRLQSTLPANIRQLSAVVVAIAVLDKTSRAIVKDYSKLISTLPDAEDGKDILSLWGPIVNNPGFAQKAGIPVHAAQAVRIYQRYYYLN
jgi:hypothetical protein